MHCSHCHAEYVEDDLYCRQCGADVPVTSTSIATTHSRLPAVLQHPRLSRSVAASVGAVALGFGIELLRRGLLARLTQPAPSSLEQSLPLLSGVKELVFPSQKEKLSRRLKKGYEVEETVVYMRRVIRR